MRPFGNPATPRARSREKEPEGITLTFVFRVSPRVMMAPSQNLSLSELRRLSKSCFGSSFIGLVVSLFIFLIMALFIFAITLFLRRGRKWRRIIYDLFYDFCLSS